MQIFNLKQNKHSVVRLLSKKGFSLLELLIYLAILSVLVVVIANIFISLSKSNAQSQAKSEVNSAIRFASELLRQDIKSSSVISVPTTPGGTTSPTLTLTRDGVVIIWDTSAGVLRRKEGSANPINVTNANVLVGTPVFTRIENANQTFGTTNVSIGINITFSYNSASPDSTYSDSLQTTINSYNAYQ
ncbi:MAG: prepilin-type N-terminal cleavage/methylation domain-containing protein [Minisyncoccia bacterium]